MIHAACCFDDAMAVPACVVAASAAAVTRDAHVMFYLVHTPKLSIRVADLKARLDSEIFTVVDLPVTRDLSGLHSTKQYSEAAYYRFLLPELLDVDRVIYLDSDTLVRKSLAGLYGVDLQGRPLGAARDYALLHHMRDNDMPVFYRGEVMPVEAYAADILGLDLAKAAYFNSGVQVLDLRLWREMGLGRQCMEFCAGHAGLVMADQDGANAVFGGNFAEIDHRWNAFSYLYYEYFPRAGEILPQIFSGYEKNFKEPVGTWRDILASWAHDPWIVHFSYRSKPWESEHRRTDYDGEYWRMAESTPFGARLRHSFAASRRKAMVRRRLREASHRFPLRYLRPLMRKFRKQTVNG